MEPGRPTSQVGSEMQVSGLRARGLYFIVGIHGFDIQMLDGRPVLSTAGAVVVGTVDMHE